MTSVFVTAVHSDVLRLLFSVSSLLCACLSLFLCSAFSAFRYTDVVLTAHFLVVEHCSALIMRFVQFFHCLFQKPFFLPVTDFWSI